MSHERPTKTYCCEYDHDGSTWCLTITAYDWADAEARVKKLGYLRLKGELMATVPARLGFIARFLCFVQNAVKSL